MRWKLSLRRLATTWRLLLIRSIVVLAVSVAALPWPHQSLARFLVLTSCIALTAGLLDAALFGALHRSTSSAWALLPEALAGVTLAAVLLLYPVVPLMPVGVLLGFWAVARGGALLLVAHDISRDPLLRTLSVGWGAASLLAGVLTLTRWRGVAFLSLAFALVVYGLLWGVLELAIALRLRARTGSVGHARA